MSRPPLPPGAPPRQQYQPSPYGENTYRPQDDHYRGDHNRAPYSNQEAPPPYQFRGNNDYDSRPVYGRQTPPGQRSPPRNNYRPPPSNNYGAVDFDFRYAAPPGIDPHRSDMYRPHLPPQQSFHDDGRIDDRAPPGARRGDNRRQRGGRDGRGRGGYRGRGGPRKAADRDFLRTNRAPTPELMAGIDEYQGNGKKYRELDEMSGSEDGNNLEVEGPHRKHARTSNKAADGGSVPRWSNPDPYTALPPPDESQRKKKDVVELIRKARVTDGAEGASKTEAISDDFISFDFDEDETMSTDTTRPTTFGVPVNAPRQPARQEIPRPPQPQGSAANAPRIKISLPNKPPTNLPNRPTKANVDTAFTSDPTLGNRKRTIRDEIKVEAPAHLYSTDKGKTKPSDGSILRTWLGVRDSQGTPWIIEVDYSKSANMGIWLHKELIDFYDYVKPRDFEQDVRTKLLEDLKLASKRVFPAYDIRPFGSFPAGLYLPTSDMDLVCVSNAYLKNGHSQLGFSQRHLHKFADFLKKQNIAALDSVQVIAKAKVPLVKYVDRVTGLKVDVSFENDTGLIANTTFQDWKVEFPSMPLLVTVIKHLLAMRGLNEPMNGGIGGFSVICLVVSLLQNMPQVQSLSMIPEHHYGEILMEFLDLYGHQFNYSTTAISLKPAQYLAKSHVSNMVYNKNKNAPKFMIIDPNRPDNDISGGASNTPKIVNCFSNAYHDLQSRMNQLLKQDDNERANRSVLGCILGGNYSSFENQRAHLRLVHEHHVGSTHE